MPASLLTRPPCSYLVAIEWMLPFTMSLGWMLSVGMIVRAVVREKETRMKEVMRMMGLGRGQLWLAWFIVSFLTLSVSAIFIVLILKVSPSICVRVCLCVCTSRGFLVMYVCVRVCVCGVRSFLAQFGNILGHTDAIVLFLFLLVYCVAVVLYW